MKPLNLASEKKVAKKSKKGRKVKTAAGALGSVTTFFKRVVKEEKILLLFRIILELECKLMA